MTTSSAYDSTVNSFYLAFYGRPADPAGLQFWSQQLQNAGGNLAAITAAFANSSEAQANFGTLGAAERITGIYEQLFDREPDAEGLAYWVDVVAKGHASLADVSIAILNAAMNQDRTLSDLRLQAADSFTAQVAASGSAYDGAAAVEAGRVLLRAVTVAATADNLSVLVKSAVEFADVATRTPAVIDAIGGGASLLDLFDTAHGKADPMALAQALADTAKAAASNPATLAELARDGGLAQMLKTMPAGVSVHDVVTALAHGGMAAAVEVMNPPVQAPSTPAPTVPTVPTTPTTPTTPDPVVTQTKLTAVTYGPNDGNLAIGEAVTLKLAFDANVQAGAGTTIALNNGGTATYTSGSGSGTLVFTYVPKAGESIADLGMASAKALSGSITDSAGKAISLPGLDGANPAGLLAVDGLQTVVSVDTANHDGPLISRNKGGELYIVDAGGTQHLLFDDSDNPSPGKIVFAGGLTSVTGTLLLKAPSGAEGVDGAHTVLTLGSDANDQLSGQFVWGWEGNDVITGTSGIDVLNGGAGADTFIGGAGGDLIDLGSDNDADLVVLRPGGSGTPFVNGGSTRDIVKISGIGDGERLDLGSNFAATGQLRFQFQTGGAVGDLATVHGSDEGGVFVKGSASTDDDVMLQWIDGGGVHSVILHDIGVLNLFLTVQVGGSTIVVSSRPTLDSISYGTNDGQLAVGEAVTLKLAFSEPVYADANTTLALNSGGTATYTSGNGSDTLVFTYVPRSGESTADLAIADQGALSGSIKDGHGIELPAEDLAGQNPAGVLAVDPFTVSVSFYDQHGVSVTNNKDGDIYVVGANGVQTRIFDGAENGPNKVVINQVDAGVGPLSGTILVKMDSGATAIDPKGTVVTLGTAADEQLAGQHVWAGDGNDVVNGTSGDDTLFGNAGDDTINGGAGFDVIYGGAGHDTINAGAGDDFVVGNGDGDWIDLGSDNESDLVEEAPAQASATPFVDGGSTVNIDKITGIGASDVIDTAHMFVALQMRTSYLTGDAEDDFAIVRGSDAGGVFVAGQASTDNDYMLQWVNGTVRSVILHDYGVQAPVLTIDTYLGEVTFGALVAPVPPAA
jgi:Ca2+-binding RTX toxin-like protein